MRKISILLLAFGIGTLVACGGAEVTVNEGDDHAEEAKGDEKAEEKAEEEGSDEKAEEEGAAEEEAPAAGGDAAAKVCCEMKSKDGPLTRMVDPEMCKKRKGTELDKEKCKK